MNTSRKKIQSVIVKSLKDAFSLEELKKIQIKMKMGELEGVFWVSVNQAVDSKVADKFQEEDADIPGDFGTHQYHDIG